MFLITLVLGQGVFYKFYNKPNMAYEILPSHTIGDQQTYSVIIKNKGRVLLHNILISIKSTDTIKQLRLDGPEIIDTSGNKYLVSGNIGDKRLQLKLDRLVTKSTYSLTLLSDIGSKIDITISSNEVEAKIEKTKKGIQPIDIIINILLAMVIGFSTYLTFKFSKWRKTLRNLDDKLVSIESCADKRLENGTKLIDFYQRVIEQLQNMLKIIETAENQYGDKDQFLKILEKYKEFHKLLTEMINDMCKQINIEGICYNVKEKKD